MILLDTSGILAALFPDQRGHQQAARALLAAEPPRVLSPFVLAETDYLIQKLANVETELAFLGEVSRGAYELAAFDAGDVEQAREILSKYKNLRLGLADASIAVLALRYGVREFYRWTSGTRAIRVDRKSFRILPADQ